MDKCINFRKYMGYLFDDKRLLQKGTEIIHALLAAQSPRLTHIASQMKGKSERNYQTIQRFLTQVDLKSALLHVHQEEAEFVIGDPTEMPRHIAPKTSYLT